MSKEDSLWFALAGAVVWGAATLFYAAFAGGLIEQAFWFYALNAALAAGAPAFSFHLPARRYRVTRLGPEGAEPKEMTRKQLEAGIETEIGWGNLIVWRLDPVQQ